MHRIQMNVTAWNKNKTLYMTVPCSLQDHASEFAAVTGLSKFGYFPVGQGNTVPGFSLRIVVAGE